MLVAPSTAQDPECRLVRVGARGARRRAGAGAWRRPTAHVAGERASRCPANAVLVDWLCYSQLMPLADLVDLPRRPRDRCPGAGGRARRCSAVPAVGDMAENGARVAWSGAGLMLPVAADWRRAAAPGGAHGSSREPALPGRGRRDRRLGAGPRRRRARRRAGRASWPRARSKRRCGGLSRAAESSGGGTRTHNPFGINSRIALPIELPRNVASRSTGRPPSATGYAG